MQFSYLDNCLYVWRVEGRQGRSGRYKYILLVATLLTSQNIHNADNANTRRSCVYTNYYINNMVGRGSEVRSDKLCYKAVCLSLMSGVMFHLNYLLTVMERGESGMG